jgi:hypothetical protein
VPGESKVKSRRDRRLPVTRVTLVRSQLWLGVNEPGDPGEQLPRLLMSG